MIQLISYSIYTVRFTANVICIKKPKNEVLNMEINNIYNNEVLNMKKGEKIILNGEILKKKL